MDNDKLDRIAGELSHFAKEYGVEGYEAYISETEKLSVSIDNDKSIENLHADEEYAIAVRILKNQRLGFSFSFNLADNALEEVFRRAIDSSSVLEKQVFSFVESQPDKTAPDSFYDKSIEAISNVQRLELLNVLVDAAHRDKRIILVEKPSYEEAVSSISIMNSSGVLKRYRASRFGISLSVLAKQGDESQMTWDFQGANTFAALNAQKLGKNCAELALKTIGGDRLSTGFYDTLFTPLVASQFLSVVAHSFAADAVYKKTSLLADKLHQQIFPDHINIIDDPSLKEGLGSVPFDAEGSPAVVNPLIHKGIVNTFLYDKNYAMLMNSQTTGSAVRQTVTQPPSIGVTNIVLDTDKPCEKDLKEVLSDGPVITEVMGMHTVNPVTGEFSLGARGYTIKSGNFYAPLKDITIAGNLFSLFNSIQPAGSDPVLYGHILTPSLLIKQLKIAGAGE